MLEWWNSPELHVNGGVLEGWLIPYHANAICKIHVPHTGIEKAIGVLEAMQMVPPDCS